MTKHSDIDSDTFTWSEIIGAPATHTAFEILHNHNNNFGKASIFISPDKPTSPTNNINTSTPDLTATMSNYVTSPPTLQTILIQPLPPHAVLFTYNQPQISNAFTLQQYHDLATALLWARHEPSITTIVLTGSGKHYCAGKVLLSPSSAGPTIAQEIEAGGALSAQLVGYPKVLVAAVHGAAIGWGCTQLWNFDLVYAWEAVRPTREAPGAVFQTPFTQLGFVPEGASSWTFERVMGKQRANALLLAAEKLSAQEMYEAGLVTKVIRDDSKEGFLEQVKGIAERVSGYNAESLLLTKAALNRPTVLAEQREAGMREGVDLQRMLSGDAAKKMMAEFQSKKKSKL